MAYPTKRAPSAPETIHFRVPLGVTRRLQRLARVHATATGTYARQIFMLALSRQETTYADDLANLDRLEAREAAATASDAERQQEIDEWEREHDAD